VQKTKSDKYSRYCLLGALALLPLAYSFGVSPAAAAEIAQAIPSVTPAGVYNQNSASGQLGEAIDKASQDSTAVISETAPINLPRVDAISATGSVTDNESRMIAEASGATSPDSNTVDLAPVKLPERTTAVFQSNQFQTGLLYKLPARMFLLSTTENSLRLETNVFQTLHRNRADMVYRVLPNVTVGYALTKRTRVSANYFFLKDQYTRNAHTLSRNIHSIGVQLQHDFPLTEKTNLTAGIMGRQLLLSRSQPLSDILPSVQLTHRVGNNGVIYGGVLGQIRFRNTLGKFQEGDQFYNFGGVYRTPRWQFLFDNTFITNFGNRRLRFGPNNQNWIMTLQADYKVSPKLPLIAFVRAEPIFNIGANQAIGFAGFNFRIMGGLRIDLAKAPVFPIKTAK